MNSILYFTFPLGVILIFSLAIGLGVFLTRRYNLGWRLYGIGAALFVFSQILHIPFNFLLNKLVAPETWQPIYSAVLWGLSAGLFEELVRYGGLRWWAKDARSWAKGLLFGSGWGGIEAILVGAIILINYIYMIFLRTQDLSTNVPPEQLALLQEGVNAYWALAWYDSMLGALERIFTLPIQIALTILVLQVFIRGQSRWLWIAIAWHTLLDAVAVISVRQWGAYATEGILSIFTLLSIGIIFALRGEESHPEDEDREIVPDDKPEIEPVELPPIEENPDNIDQTRFTE